MFSLSLCLLSFNFLISRSIYLLSTENRSIVAGRSVDRRLGRANRCSQHTAVESLLVRPAGTHISVYFSSSSPFILFSLLSFLHISLSLCVSVSPRLQLSYLSSIYLLSLASFPSNNLTSLISLPCVNFRGGLPMGFLWTSCGPTLLPPGAIQWISW